MLPLVGSRAALIVVVVVVPSEGGTRTATTTTTTTSAEAAAWTTTTTVVKEATRRLIHVGVSASVSRKKKKKRKKKTRRKKRRNPCPSAWSLRWAAANRLRRSNRLWCPCRVCGCEAISDTSTTTTSITNTSTRTTAEDKCSVSITSSCPSWPLWRAARRRLRATRKAKRKCSVPAWVSRRPSPTGWRSARAVRAAPPLTRPAASLSVRSALQMRTPCRSVPGASLDRSRPIQRRPSTCPPAAKESITQESHRPTPPAHLFTRPPLPHSIARPSATLWMSNRLIGVAPGPIPTWTIPSATRHSIPLPTHRPLRPPGSWRRPRAAAWRHRPSPSSAAIWRRGWADWNTCALRRWWSRSSAILPTRPTAGRRSSGNKSLQSTCPSDPAAASAQTAPTRRVPTRARHPSRHPNCRPTPAEDWTLLRRRLPVWASRAGRGSRCWREASRCRSISRPSIRRRPSICPDRTARPSRPSWLPLFCCRTRRDSAARFAASSSTNTTDWSNIWLRGTSYPSSSSSSNSRNSYIEPWASLAIPALWSRVTSATFAKGRLPAAICSLDTCGYIRGSSRTRAGSAARCFHALIISALTRGRTLERNLIAARSAPTPHVGGIWSRDISGRIPAAKIWTDSLIRAKTLAKRRRRRIDKLPIVTTTKNIPFAPSSWYVIV